jgi:hypothetical protein
MTDIQAILTDKLINHISINIGLTAKVATCRNNIATINIYFKNDVNTKLKTVVNKIKRLLLMYKGLIFMEYIKSPKRTYVLGYDTTTHYFDGYSTNYITLVVKVTDKNYLSKLILDKHN